MSSTVRIDGVIYTYHTIPQEEIRYISLMELPNFQKGKIYGGKRLGSDYLMHGDNGNFLVFFDQEIDDYFMVEG